MSAAVDGHWDETARSDGAPNPIWQRLMGALEGIGRAEFVSRWERARRLLEENGVTYNVYGDPRGVDRPWQLDPIPMLLDAREWAGIEAAVGQRALLLDRILADLYGPQRLLRDDLLPPELVFAHPGFLRPCHGIDLPGDRYLHVYAADLARSPDGQWWVIADRCQVPSGAGYALENRVVMSRILPELFGEFYVRRLAPYFRAYRQVLRRLAPEGCESPRIVMLTPGPYNETYFEHAYLARYLGFDLVEGGDLTVRDDRLFLKTLSGLQRVDVVLRRQDAHFCDPLELWGESALGVPGLTQAVRAGRVTVANALGSGLAETAATMAFLPGLCRELLGETLRMPSVATWWCGQPRELEHALAHFDQLVFKPAFPGPAGPDQDVVFGGELSGPQQEALRERLCTAPHRWVAQEKVALSTVPTGDGEGLQPRHMVLRVYAVADGEGWTLMPGGLTRVSTTADSLVVSSQRGGASKDTWVLADAPTPYVSLLSETTRPAEVSRSSFSLTSRVADNLLWLGRGSERVEASVRLFQAALQALADEPLRPADAPVPDAIALVERLGRLPRPAADEDLQTRLLGALFDASHADSVAASVSEVHRLAWLLRDRISPDAWRVLSRLDQDFVAPEVHPALRVSGALDRLDRALLRIAAFTGLVVESMTRALGWQFLEVGRRLERAVQMVDLLRASLVEEIPEGSRWLETVLAAADCSMTYRSRYQAALQLPLVLDLLLVDELNPRSVGFQLVGLEERFRTLHRAPHEELRELLAQVRETPLDELVQLSAGDDGRARRAALEQVLDALVVGLPELADAINHAYLSHAVPQRRGPGVRREQA
ncbi:MAG: circularly permuted type 2 ATP-grasp protein [Myxococcota bacterium]|nr:circularly permuted type 2 ATP-grasp protein [Myxococcota bacterium]